MIKVIQHNHTSLNVVDDQNNFVGYSLEDDFCAVGGWFIDDKEHASVAYDEKIEHLQSQVEFPEYVFDETYFKETSIEDGGMIIFKLKDFSWNKKKKPDLYLHLFNLHNGYYAKGFKCTFGEKREGSL